jgi:hypothetical protein
MVCSKPGHKVREKHGFFFYGLFFEAERPAFPLFVSRKAERDTGAIVHGKRKPLANGKIAVIFCCSPSSLPTLQHHHAAS